MSLNLTGGTCPCGEIGIRARFRIWWFIFRVGSSPIMGTNFKKLDNMKKVDHYTVRDGYEMCYFGSTEYSRINNQIPTYYPPKR